MNRDDLPDDFPFDLHRWHYAIARTARANGTQHLLAEQPGIHVLLEPNRKLRLATADGQTIGEIPAWSVLKYGLGHRDGRRAGAVRRAPPQADERTVRG